MTADVGAQLRKGVVEYCILGILAREPMYGWQLADTLSRPGVIAGIGTLYPLLGRLRDNGLIVAFEKASGVGPTRKYYRPTPAGLEHLAAFRVHWPRFIATVSMFVEEDHGDTH